MASSFEILVYKRRTTVFQYSLFEVDGTTGIVLASTDVVRFKMGRGDGTEPILDLDTIAETPNGSGVFVDQLTAPAKVTVTFAQSDVLTINPGTYEGEITVVDDSEASPPLDAIKVASIGVVHVIGSMAGADDLTN